MKKIIYITLVLMLAACSAVSQSEFDQNQTKWKDANISHYRYTIFIGCFCAFSEEMPLTIEVKDGEAVSIMRADGTLVRPTDTVYGWYQPYETIDRLFLKLEADLGGEADEVTVSYDPQYGFPLTISIDQILEAVDDELALQVSNFEILE